MEKQTQSLNGATPISLPLSKARLTELALGLTRGQGRALLGITGPPGAGKSTLAQWLVRALVEAGTAAAYVPMDGFHLSNQQLRRLGRAGRKGAPDTFDASGLAAVMERIRAGGEDVYVPEYRRDLHEPIAAGLVIERDCELVVVEGNYLLLDSAGWAEVSRLLDACWFLSAPPDLRRQRLLARSRAAGRGPREAEAWVHDVDEANARFIEASAERAALVISITDDLEQE